MILLCYTKPAPCNLAGRRDDNDDDTARRRRQRMPETSCLRPARSGGIVFRRGPVMARAREKLRAVVAALFAEAEEKEQTPVSYILVCMTFSVGKQ